MHSSFYFKFKINFTFFFLFYRGISFLFFFYHMVFCSCNLKKMEEITWNLVFLDIIIFSFLLLVGYISLIFILLEKVEKKKEKQEKFWTTHLKKKIIENFVLFFEIAKPILLIQVILSMFFGVIYICWDIHSTVSTKIDLTGIFIKYVLYSLATYSLFYFLKKTPYLFPVRVIFFIFRPGKFFLEKFELSSGGSPMYMSGHGRQVVPSGGEPTVPPTASGELFDEIAEALRNLRGVPELLPIPELRPLPELSSEPFASGVRREIPSSSGIERGGALGAGTSGMETSDRVGRDGPVAKRAGSELPEAVRVRGSKRSFVSPGYLELAQKVELDRTKILTGVRDNPTLFFEVPEGIVLDPVTKKHCDLAFLDIYKADYHVGAKKNDVEGLFRHSNQNVVGYVEHLYKSYNPELVPGKLDYYSNNFHDAQFVLNETQFLKDLYEGDAVFKKRIESLKKKVDGMLKSGRSDATKYPQDYTLEIDTLLIALASYGRSIGVHPVMVLESCYDKGTGYIDTTKFNELGRSCVKENHKHLPFAFYFEYQQTPAYQELVSRIKGELDRENFSSTSYTSPTEEELKKGVCWWIFNQQAHPGYILKGRQVSKTIWERAVKDIYNYSQNKEHFILVLNTEG